MRATLFAGCVFGLVSSAVWQEASPPDSVSPPTKDQRQVVDDLNAKLAELEALRVEVDRLRALSGIDSRRVLVRVQGIEFSRKKLREGGYLAKDSPLNALFEEQSAQSGQAPDAGTAFNVYSGTKQDSLVKLLQTLREKGLVKVVAEPCMIATNGQHASFHAGGEFSVPCNQPDGTIVTQTRRYGTSMKVHPVLLENRVIRATLDFEVANLDFGLTVVTDYGVAVPGLAIINLHHQFEVKSGALMVLSGMCSLRKPVLPTGKRNEDESDLIDIVVLITPEIVE